ncbi:sensory neuron membrane protein 2-like [Bicyclus anynana]|uniref:Sensory neuron membrane protein 2 n=1 Tax=Bicyclus anynana TaxID=110368 RepID=A0A6J1MXA7_BICAN|nr:sensory neuron membrane protein 2-like [Bicyclus anynana]
MCYVATGVTITVLGAALVIVVTTLSYTLVPNLVESVIKSEVRLDKNTEQWERFESIPFALHFSVRIFNISNKDEVLAGGVPVLNELGPYIYKSYQERIIEGVDGDEVTYRKRDYMEFDAEASYPLTLEDQVTIVNVPYHGILQMAEMLFPDLINMMGAALNGVFGVHNSPIMTVTVGALLFGGIPICANPGFIGGIACNQIRPLAADVQNIEEKDDGSLEFTILKYKHDNPSNKYVVSRGVDDVMELGIIRSFNGSAHLNHWPNETDDDGNMVVSQCNMLNGTDSGIFPPFVNREKSIYAFNTDICRSAELRYDQDVVYNDRIPAIRFSANEWFLDNHQGCFCLNMTSGITRPDGCLYPGVMEMYTCVGALMVLSYPHFLYADSVYRNGIIGMAPNEEAHRIFLDLEPNTGTVVRGFKRAQFNIFMRRIDAIPATHNLRTTLTPILWIEEGMELPDDFVDMINDRLLSSLRLVDILIPVLISICCLVFALGVVILIYALKTKKNASRVEQPHDKNSNWQRH